MAESKKSKNEKLKEEKKVIEEELTKSAKKQEQTEQQLQRAENLATFLKANERRSGAIRLAIKGAIIEGIAPCLKYCSDQELYDLMDYIFSMPPVQQVIMERQRIILEEQDEEPTGTR